MLTAKHLSWGRTLDFSLTEPGQGLTANASGTGLCAPGIDRSCGQVQCRNGPRAMPVLRQRARCEATRVVCFFSSAKIPHHSWACTKLFPKFAEICSPPVGETADGRRMGRHGERLGGGRMPATDGEPVCGGVTMATRSRQPCPAETLFCMPSVRDFFPAGSPALVGRSVDRNKILQTNGRVQRRGYHRAFSHAWPPSACIPSSRDIRSRTGGTSPCRGPRSPDCG